MKKLLLSLAVLLPCLMASAQSYTLSFVECEKTDGDGGTAYTKDVASIFGETDSVASIDKRDNIFPARIGCGAKFGTSTKKGIIEFTLATPVEVDSIVISAAMYSETEGADGFLAINVLAGDTTAFTLSAGNKVFEDCVWKPADKVTTIRINQATAANQRFYAKSITIYPKAGVPSAIEATATAAEKAQKVIRNGQVLILRGNKTYDALGNEINF